MNKKNICLAVLFFALVVSVFAGRKEIEECIKALEVTVAEAEAMAKKSSVSQADFSKLSKIASEADVKGEKVKEEELTPEDKQRIEKLEERFNKALETIISKL